MTVQSRFPARCTAARSVHLTLPWPTTTWHPPLGCTSPGEDRISSIAGSPRGPTCSHLSSLAVATEWLLPPQLNLPCIEPLGADELAAYASGEAASPGGPVVHDDEDETNLHFGQHVRGLRRARGMTQEVLAIRSGLSIDTVRRLEHGSFSPSLDTLRKLCIGLDLMLSSLFEGYEYGARADGETREIIDLLAKRSASEQLMAVKLLRGLFEGLDLLARPAGHD